MANVSSGPSLPPKTHFAEHHHAPRNLHSHHPFHLSTPLQSSSAPNLCTATPHTTPGPPQSEPQGQGAPTSYSNKWLAALKAKPTLSRTWEKRSYVEEQMGLPATASGDLEAGSRQQMQLLSNRPTSLYASPAAIAAFRALPPHSAPPTPTNGAQQV